MDTPVRRHDPNTGEASLLGSVLFPGVVGAIVIDADTDAGTDAEAEADVDADAEAGADAEVTADGDADVDVDIALDTVKKVVEALLK